MYHETLTRKKRNIFRKGSSNPKDRVNQMANFYEMNIVYFFTLSRIYNCSAKQKWINRSYLTHVPHYRTDLWHILLRKYNFTFLKAKEKQKYKLKKS